MRLDYQKQTQAYSTWGDKLLQHTDRLNKIQEGRWFDPITLQLAPTELCDSDCSFCSVGNRPKGKIDWEDLLNGIREFSSLGIKSIELTGGGNPSLYRDGDHNVNHIIDECAKMNLDIGVITNSERPSRWYFVSSLQSIKWMRVSLAKLDEGCGPDDFDFTGLPEGKLGLSYIVHEKTTEQTFRDIEKIVKANPSVKFVRIAADCLTEDSITIKEIWGDLVAKLDPRFFIKEINDNFVAHQGGCWIGMLRPYWTSTGVYICTSHVLKKRTYLPEYRLCGAREIRKTWVEMNRRFRDGKHPYEIDIPSCGHCYYRNGNAILDSVINELPDKNFA